MNQQNGILLVEALYSFTGSNNDELCFKKGDLIVVTQKEDGGWWEGTLSDNTGWFPSNYVIEYNPPEGDLSSWPISVIDSPPLSPEHCQQQILYHSVVSKEILDSERNHVEELQNVFNKFLIPLHRSDIISDAEFKQLTGNYEDILAVHRTLLKLLEEQFDRPFKEQKLGGTYLKMAPTLETVHKLYISNHPKAVCIIDKYREKLNDFMECQGASSPGSLALTMALSHPFRRLDKYPGVLQEFHRHQEECHPDRGDTQRSSHVFWDLNNQCSALRRQKQLELEVVSNKIEGWREAETLAVLGDIIRMSSVALLPDNRDRYLVLFPACLVVLALSSKASSFIFQGKYMLADLIVEKLPDSQYKNTFQIKGPYMEPIVAVCQSAADQNFWVELLRRHIQSVITSASLTGARPKPPHSLYRSPPTLHTYTSPQPSSEASSSSLFISPWSMSCLRPTPAVRPTFTPKEDKKSSKHKKKDDSWNEDDALVLKVIESYCTSAKSRHTVNATTSPQLLNPSEEKIIVEKRNGKEVQLEEKSLVDTVYALQDQVKALTQQCSLLQEEFESERIVNQKFRSIICQYFKNLHSDDSNHKEMEPSLSK